MDLLYWDIYELTSEETLHGVMFRGRIRKFGIVHKKNILVENTSDKENALRIAVPAGESVKEIEAFVKGIFPAICMVLLEEHVANPVLSKLQVNKADRYTID